MVLLYISYCPFCFLGRGDLCVRWDRQEGGSWIDVGRVARTKT